MAHVNKRRVLIIDDQYAIHDDYRKIINPSRTDTQALDEAESQLFGLVTTGADESQLYEIDSAYQGEDAFHLVEKAVSEGRPYALAFVDIQMPPGWDGIHTVRRIWEVDPEILIVLCSAYSDYSWDDIVTRLGRTDRFLILRKPFDGVEVRQCAAALSERWIVARTDAMTGLLNRRSFEEHLRREWAYQLREGNPLACVTVDVDYFKTINDRYGHAAGDQVLVHLAELIVAHSRPGDTVCRYGGEEICILMPNTTEEAACQWAEQLRVALEQHPFAVGDDGLHMTASFGVGVSHADMCHAEDLIGMSDEALRAAKQAGRNKVIGSTEVKQVQAGVHRLREYASYFEELTAEEIMTGSMVCVNQQTIVADAISTMLQCQITCVPVVDDNGLLTGIVTEKDIMESLGSTLGWQNTVANIMTSRVIQYEKHTPANVIFDFLCRVQIRRVVIVQEGRPVGIVSRASFLRWMRNYIGGFETASVDVRPHLLKTANALLERATVMHGDIERDPPDVLAPVVTGVTNIQTLLNELLSWAKCSSSTQGSERFAGINE